jgi:hypothetical protein
MHSYLHKKIYPCKKWVLHVLIWKGMSITSISMHEHLTFVKHIYVDVNADVMAARPRFMQQEWAGLVGAAEVGLSSRIYSLF